MNDVMYLCDRKRCENCTYPRCKYTTDISHAANFHRTIGGYWEEELAKCLLSPNQYQQEALRTEPRTEYPRILQGLMGLCGEAGEAMDILKKHLFQGHDLDREHLAKELGDVAWYLAVSADAIDFDLEEIFRMNIEKLRARYPDGFDTDRSIHRKEGDV